MILLLCLLWRTLEDRWNHNAAAQVGVTTWEEVLQKRQWGFRWTPEHRITSHQCTCAAKMVNSPVSLGKVLLLGPERWSLASTQSCWHIWRAAARPWLPTVKRIERSRENPASACRDDEEGGWGPRTVQPVEGMAQGDLSHVCTCYGE